MDINKCMCYYIDDKIKRFDPDSILINKKSFENILLPNTLYKNLIDSKPLRIRFDKEDEFIRVYDGTKFLVLFRIVKYDYSYQIIRNFINVKSGITYITSHNMNYVKYK